jgi:hypothetical protein
MTCEGNLTIREIEIQEQLERLYAQLEAFDEPTPAEAPFEYEVEEFESWEKLRKQIRVLEHELAQNQYNVVEISGAARRPRMWTGPGIIG